MICAVISGPTLKDVYEQIEKVLPYADLLELRLDLFKNMDEEAIKQLRLLFSIPMIFTLRSVQQGGSYSKNEIEYQNEIRSLLVLKPEYLDVESHLPVEFFEEIRANHPKIKLICSYHNFKSTPHDLTALYRSLKEKPAFYYKIAVMSENSSEALRLLNWKKNEDKKLIAIGMGSYGKISRILAPIVGSPITYACVDEDNEIAPGQCSAQTLVDLYHYRSLHLNTHIYGLIGDPVDLSTSHESHNALIKALHLDAVYIKMPVKASELQSFLILARQLPFSGLSVTMPLKEEVMAYLDTIDPEAHTIGAVNTLYFENGKITGYNTDGVGALEAVEREFSVKEKKIVIIGAGGAAKAVAYEAKKRGAHVTLLNRNQERAHELAQCLNCVGAGLEKMQSCFSEGYDLLINTTPVGLPIDPKFLLPSAFVMDIKTRPKEPLLLQEAKQKKCRLIYGYLMFVEQAVRQFDIWFKGTVPQITSRKVIEDKMLALLG